MRDRTGFARFTEQTKKGVLQYAPTRSGLESPDYYIVVGGRPRPPTGAILCGRHPPKADSSAPINS